MQRRCSMWHGVAAGLVGGLVASWTMNQFQLILSKSSEKLNEKSEKSQQKEKGDAQGDNGEDATMKAADKVWAGITGSPLSKRAKKTAGPIVHYLFGSVMGGIYGATAEYLPAVTFGEGALFGTLLFVGADEVAVPALGLSKFPTEYPVSSHASALAAHLVYGGTAEVVRGLVRKVL